MYDDLIKRLRNEANCPDNYPEDSNLMREAADAIEELSRDLDSMNEANIALYGALPKWIPVTKELPECEQEVLICTEKKLVGRDAYIDSIVTPAIYEDGTMRENDSIWRWEDIDWAGWDEEEDCGIIPEGWWENRHFNPDDVYNNPVDRKVVAWMPLPESYKPPKEET